MRVLLATDGSTDAKRAAEWLKESPLPDETAVLALCVAALPGSPVPLLTMKDLREAVLADSHRIITDTKKLLAPRWPEAEVRVSEGDPREEIPRVAEEWNADLIVLGARGLGKMKGVLLGSVSRTVVQHAPCSALVVKGRPRSLRNVLVALDGSAHALDALKFLGALPLGTLNVRLLFVVEPLHLPPSAPGFIQSRLKSALAELKGERRAEAERVLKRAESELQGEAKSVGWSVAEGLPGEEIAREVSEREIDLVILGRRGIGAVKRILLGSVSEKVLGAAQCPVLIVKPTA
jgi:nucleotide-binding universal stress UspA family protein